MMRAVSLIVLGIVAAVSFEPAKYSCNGDCPKGYHSVCVERNGNCRCDCVKDVGDGAVKLAALLNEAKISKTAVSEGVRRYREFATRSTDDFSFVLNDETQTVTVSGQGFGPSRSAPKDVAGRAAPVRLGTARKVAWPIRREGRSR
jgi:hypothetical protein